MTIKNILQRAVGPCVSAIRSIPPVVTAISYNPEKKRKPFLRRYAELLSCRILYGYVNTFYNAYGLDCYGSENSKDYVGEKEFWNSIIPLNYAGKAPYAVMLRDKYWFSMFMHAHALPHPRMVAFSNHGHYYFADRQEVSYEDWVSAIISTGSVLFVKEATSCCARGVTKVSGTWPFRESDFMNSKFIVQEAVRNCEMISKIQPNSVNTLRIVTVVSQRTGRIELLSPGGLRVGGGGSVDNWAAGGLFVGISENGLLQRHGVYKPGMHDPCKEAVQPQTGVRFEGFEVPYYEAAVALVKRAHSFLPEVVTIGWDVALTTDGPVIIEGNEDWEVSLMQIVAGGLLSRCVELGIIKG